MAQDGVVQYFKKGQSKFETEGRSVSVAEFNTQTVKAIAPYSWLLNQRLKGGDPIPAFVEQGTVSFGTLYIRDYRIDRLDGNMGQLTINCVEAANLTSPYNVTVDIDLAQVEKKLINHPLLNSVTTQFQIRLFEKTEENYQYDENGNPQCMYRLTDETTGSGGSSGNDDSSSATGGKAGDPLVAPVLLTDEWAIKYAKAKLIGIDSYSIYLPVVTRTSQYLALPGVNINRSNMSASGTANPSGIQNVGDFDTPPINVAGFLEGEYFKNGEKFTQNANGSWTRTEAWTYTNDLRADWIYRGGAAKGVVDSSGKLSKSISKKLKGVTSTGSLYGTGDIHSMQ